MNEDEEELKKIITIQQEAIGEAIDMLEALVLEEDVNPDKVEDIIKVLTYVS